MIALAGAAWAADGQLVDPVRPTSQRIWVALDPARPETEGHTILALDVRAATRTFLLHSDELELSDPTIRRFGKRPRPVRIEPAGPGLLRVTAEEVLEPGVWELDLRFRGVLHDQAYGLYRFAVDDRWYVASQFEPDEARTAWPCFDEPAFKIPFTLQVTVPDGNQVIANAPVAARNVRPAGVEVQFEPTEPIPSYALALLVGPYVPHPIPELERTTVWTVAGHEDWADGIAEVLPRVDRSQRGWFGSAPPWEKQDLVVVPEFAYGAMENPGAMVFAEAVVPPPDRSGPGEAESTAHVVAHEYAHLWFGDWVTMEWWDDLWLNESFADWMARRTVHELFPEYRGELGRVDRLYAMLAADANPATQPLRTEVDPNAVFETANFAVYVKGEALLDMVEGWVGADAFQRGLRTYLAANAGGNARAADLFLALTDASSLDVAGVLDDLLDTPGAPRLVFTRAGPGTVRVEGAALGLVGAEPPPGGPWSVPVRLRVGRPDGTSEVVARVLAGSSAEWDLGEYTWLHPAADGIGYYAWSLAGPDLDELIAAAPGLGAAERLAVVRALALEVASGQRRLAEAVARAGAFDRDPDPGVLRAVAQLVGQLGRTEDWGDPQLEAAAHRYVRERLRPIYDRLGRPADDEPLDRAVLREHLRGTLAHADDPRARAEGLDLGRRALADVSALSVADARFGLRTLAEEGHPDIARELVAAARAAPDPATASLFLGALASTRGEALADTLTWLGEPDTVHQELAEVLPALAGAREADRDVVLDGVLARWDALAAKLPPVNQRYVAMFGGGCDPARPDRLEEFFGDAPPPGLPALLAAVRADVAACGAARAFDEPGLRGLLGLAP